MDRMGIAKSNGEILQVGSNDQLAWMETTQDFSYIQAELLASRQKADRLLGAFDSLANIVAVVSRSMRPAALAH